MALSSAQLDRAKASKSLSNLSSNLTAGTRFKIEGYDYEAIDPTDEKSAVYPVFKTSIGTISVASLVRPIPVKPYEGKDGEMVFAMKPDGELSDKIQTLISANRGKSNDQLLPLLVEALKDDEYVVTKLRFVTAETQYGTMPRSLPVIDRVRS